LAADGRRIALLPVWGFRPACGKEALKSLLKDWQSLTATVGTKDTDTDVYDLRNILQFGLPIIICYGFIPWPTRCGLSIGALLLATAYYPGFNEDLLHQERNFFGVLRAK